MRAAAALVAALALAACSKPAGPTERGTEPAPVVGNQGGTAPRPQEGTVTEVRDYEGIEKADGQVVAIVGTYSVVSTGRHKIMKADGSGGSNEVVRLVLDDETNVDLWLRPDDEKASLAGKTVVATGKLIAKPNRTGPGAKPDAGPSLVEIKSIVEK